MWGAVLEAERLLPGQMYVGYYRGANVDKADSGIAFDQYRSEDGLVNNRDIMTVKLNVIMWLL